MSHVAKGWNGSGDERYWQQPWTPSSRPDAARRSSQLRRLVDRVGGVTLVVVAVVFAVLVVDGALDRLGVVTATVPDLIAGLAAVGLVLGVVRRPWAWWAGWGTGIAVASAVVVAGAAWWIHDTQLVTEHYPSSFLLWVWAAVFAVGVAVTGWWSGGVTQRVGRVLTAPLAVLAAFLLINAHYGYWPTVGALLDKPVAGQVAGSELSRELAEHRSTDPTQDSVGQYGPIAIPGTSVGFDAAEAYLWLPPDYFRVAHANLPLLLMLPGWPGNEQDWTRAGGVTEVANAWARAHGGQAPVMLFIDQNGAEGHDTECVNSPEGNAESYLTEVVPRFVTTTLGIHDTPSRWGIVGFSEGGTCAVGLTLEHPHLFGRFVDIAGDPAPNFWGGPSQTLRRLFHGRATAERNHEPLVLMAEHRYVGVDAWFGAGADDTIHAPEEAELARAAKHAGVRVHHFTSPGGHSWTYARQSFARIYPDLLAALGTAGPRRAGPTGFAPSIARVADPGRHHTHPDRT
jgi:S-formylglutathione hydrolase FrmB